MNKNNMITTALLGSVVGRPVNYTDKKQIKKRGKAVLMMYIYLGVHNGMRLKEAARIWGFTYYPKEGKIVEKSLKRGKWIWRLWSKKSVMRR